MSFITAAIIGGGAALAGGFLSANAAKSAAGTQADAAGRATDAQLHMFDTINAQQAPYRQSGYNALAALNMGLGLGGSSSGGAMPTGYFPRTGGGGGALGGVAGMLGNVQSTSAPTREQFTKSIAASPGQWVTGAAPGGAGEHATGGTTAGGSWVGATPASSSFDQAGFDKATADWNAQQGQSGTNMAQTGGTSVGGIDPGYFTHQFNASDLNANLAPNYQFQLDQGLGALKNAGNLQSGLISGNTLKGINDYAQNFAGGAYQNAFNNYTANQSNIFNRLSNIAGLGQTSTANTGNAGTTLASNAGNSMIAQGTAQAGGTVGAANAITGGLNNAQGWYTLSQIMNKNGGTT